MSRESKRGWDLFARSRSVSVVGFMEALGPLLLDLDQPEDELPDIIRAAVVRGREVDFERRRRRDY